MRGWADDSFFTGLFTPIINYEGEVGAIEDLKKSGPNIIPATSDELPDRIITYGPFDF